ncbi:hypothetical protein ACHAXA_005396 [Cyclostephanos tholiformis]|uniref:Flavodoxin-like domain-containing protein n=1 Tax=Cyclostephanos tholiformis TaxID=382380 RepID=A0ABD3RE72_9STRA
MYEAMTTTAEQTIEEILVLYGSQTGNSEAAAHEISSNIPARLSSSKSSSSSRTTTTNRRITSRVMHLDDFLEIEKGRWTRLVVIVCSSYGVGQAPIGARKFREFCDEVLRRQEQQQQQRQRRGRRGGDEDDDDDDDEGRRGAPPPSMLEGVTYALLGLGDSHYTTYFKNPTIINDALTAMGATRIGELGKADASGTGYREQSRVIERWIEGIWDDLGKALESKSSEPIVLDRAWEGTWSICLDIFPDWKPTTKLPAMDALYYLPLVGIILAMLVHYCYFRVG